MKKIIAVFCCLASFCSAASLAVSVLPFDDLSPDRKYTYAGKALAELLTADLGRVKNLLLLERTQLNKALTEMELGQTGLMDEKTAPRIGKLIGATHLIVGSYLFSGSSSVIVYKIMLVESGALAGTGRVTAGSDVIAAEKKLMRAVIASLRGIIPGLEAPENTDSSEPLDAVSLNRFGQALDAEQTGDYTRARELLKSLTDGRGNTQVFITVINNVNSRIADSDKRREEELKRSGQSTTDWNIFMRTTVSYTGSMRYTSLLEYCRRARLSPPKAPEGSIIDAREMTDYYIVFALAMLKRSEETVAEGSEFLSRYSTSMYYASVKNFVTEHLGVIKEREPLHKRTEAKIAALRADGDTEKTPRVMTDFRVAQEYFSAKMYDKALASYQSLSLGELEKLSVTPDMILYFIFQCHRELFHKQQAARIVATVENLFPESSYLATMRTLMNYMPE
ncbi:MAG: hypothetical protein HZC28_04360 [Spirochaetes bacterium]|nr:hypothetical protein [Spirochaetota bacterium]